MIFVTVGTQLPFDRLIAVVDEWAGHNPDVDVFGQIAGGSYRPKHFKYKEFVTPAESDELFFNSELVISHAGMGSILTALKHKRRILLLPRKASLGEHRNDHQIATARRLGSKPGVYVAAEAKELFDLLNNQDTLTGGGNISEFADPAFIARLRTFFDG